MTALTHNQIRSRFLQFFQEKNHAILPSAPLVPQGNAADIDQTLFTIAGVQPVAPYILKGEHPQGSRLASAQMCVRTVDLDEVGDATHATAFEMLGNWSIGDYFKKEAINWSFEFLTSTEKGVGFDPSRLYVTVFAGDERAPRDEEAYETWKAIFNTLKEQTGNDAFDPQKRIFFMEGSANWWEAGEDGPCGPDTEMFYDVTGKHTNGLTKEEFLKFDDEQEIVEVWNDVFMQFEKEKGKVVRELPQKSVDTGSGLERLAMVVAGQTSIAQSTAFAPLIAIIKSNIQNNLTEEEITRRSQIIADHIKASVLIMAEGVVPSNKAQGYIVRRLIRRAVRNMHVLGVETKVLTELIAQVNIMYAEAFPIVAQNIATIQSEFTKEVSQFEKTLQKGLKAFQKGERDAFILFTTYGFPLEMTQELAQEQGEEINVKEFKTKLKAHQQASKTASAGMFKGGLANHEPQTIKHHTAHHLLLAALQQILGANVKQRGSNINEERLRMDVSFERKIEKEELAQAQELVNKWITEGCAVKQETMKKEEAENLGAQMEFGARYPDEVSVYSIVNNQDKAISIEFCGGPHIQNTSELGQFTITSEKSSSKGVRRIKAKCE